MNKIIVLLPAVIVVFFTNCSEYHPERASNGMDSSSYEMVNYIGVTLTSDLSMLSEGDRKMIPLLIEAANIMDGLFWQQSFGDTTELMAKIRSAELKNYIRINYGPWDRLNGDIPIIPEVGEKPLGANFYPVDMTIEEFDALNDQAKTSLYTILRRNAGGELEVIPYHKAYRAELDKAAELLRKAASLSGNSNFSEYLRARADALLSDRYTESDKRWLGLKNNDVDLIIGPIENYEDKLFGYKTSYEAYILVKDKEWSAKLAGYVSYLPELQKNLPLEEKYKSEVPGSSSQLNAYDVIYYAGDCNTGSKTIAVNLPNDEEIQQEMGTRRSQLKNAMRAKFDHILMPISSVLIADSLRKHVTFDAFFTNTMFHEVAHGLGVKNTLNGRSSVREALKDVASSMEEGKADVLGLYMVTYLFKKGVMASARLEDYYVTFLASIFRSVRFGASSAHGKANMVRFNYFKRNNAFVRDPVSGTYRVDMRAMETAVMNLSAEILRLQGNGDYEKARSFIESGALIDTELQTDLDRLNAADIPVDVTFNQGLKALNLVK